MSLLDNMPHLATAYKRVRTRDSIAGTKDTYPTAVFTDRACWRQQAGASEIMEFEKRGINITHKVFFATRPSLDEKHILVVTDDNGEDKAYEVQSIASPDASAGLGILYRVMVNNTTNGFSITP